MRIIDISVPIDEAMVLWPGTSKPRLNSVSKIKKDAGWNETRIEMSNHTGTHIDAPAHFLANSNKVGKLSLEKFIGPVFVAHLPKVKKITAHDLEKLKLPRGTRRLVFKTSNSINRKKSRKFNKNYVALTSDAARWIVRQKIQLVGIDYLSIADFNETTSVHQILLGKKVIILEGLDLSAVKPGNYELICLPLKIPNAEAAPVRAILLK